MPAWFRAGLVAALFVFAAAPVFPVQSAEKTFQDTALDDDVLDSVRVGCVGQLLGPVDADRVCPMAVGGVKDDVVDRLTVTGSAVEWEGGGVVGMLHGATNEQLRPVARGRGG